MRITSAALFHFAKHLSDVELEPQLGQCPVCLSLGNREMVFDLQQQPRITLMKCSSCHACSASRMPTADALASYYSSYYKPLESKITFHEAGRFSRHLMEMVLEYMKSDAPLFRILDFGGGDGSISLSLARKLVSLGFSVEVVVVDYHVSEHWHENQLEFHSVRQLGEVTGEFDFILASAILEHIPNLDGTLHSLFQLLGEKGFLYARVPYMVPFKKYISSVDFTFPAHVHDLGPDFWAALPKRFSHAFTLVVSRASLVETSFSGAPFRTLLAYACKLPSRLEELIKGRCLLNPIWKWVGGWEVLLVKK